MIYYIKNHSVVLIYYIKNHSVRLGMVYESAVRDSNPWWKDAASILDDQKIREWRDSAIRYVPRITHKIAYDFEPSNTVVYSLRGPRQVGKTTLVKLQIKEFLDMDVSPWNVLYYSLDLANTPQDVVDVVETYFRIRARRHDGKRCYLFLDEVSSVRDWQRGIQWLVDNNKLRNCTVMVTGSHTIDIRNATEKLPGRRGKIEENYDKILLPMKFSEYASLSNKGIKSLILENNFLSLPHRKTIFMKLLNREIDKSLDNFSSYQNELSDILREYMLTGGTPKVIDEKTKTSAISESLYTSYLESVTGQWNELRKNETMLKQFCGAVIKSQGSHISWNGLSREAALGSPNTALDYAYTLKDLFVLSIVHLYGTDKRIPVIQKDRKFYFHDPYFFHIFNGLMSTKGNFETSLDYVEREDHQSKITEGIIADHLIRWAFALSKKKQTFDYRNHVFYWKDDKGREVDFILYDGDGTEAPIEVKYRNRVNSVDLTGLVSFLDKTGTGSGLVISKSDLDVRQDYVVIPAPIFLLLI